MKSARVDVPMEDTSSSSSSSSTTPTSLRTIVHDDHISVVSMDEPQTPPEAVELSALTTRAEDDKELRLFVTLTVVRLLEKCHTVQNRSQEQWVGHSKRLINQVMEGLTFTEGHCLDLKDHKKVCKAVVKALEKRFCGRKMLETSILLEEPVVDQVIVQSLKNHIKDFSAKKSKKSRSPVWRDMLQVLAPYATFIAAVTLIWLFL